MRSHEDPNPGQRLFSQQVLTSVQPYLALLLFGLALGARTVNLVLPAAANFSPVAALFLCAALFPVSRLFWLAPVGVLLLGDIWGAWAGGYAFNLNGDYLVRLLAVGGVFVFGRLFASRLTFRTFPLLAVAGSVLFYLVTNTWSWYTDSFYSGGIGGWVQALTVGHPEYPSTLYFFRNTLLSDLAFNLAFALVYLNALAPASKPLQALPAST